MEITKITQIEEFKSSILEDVLKECGETLNSILPVIFSLCGRDIFLVKDAVELLIIINEREKEILY